MSLSFKTPQAAAQLWVRLARDPQADEAWWLFADQPAQAVDLTELAQQSAVPARVLLDGQAVRLDRITLPPGVRADEAALLLEDELAQPVEDCEVCLLTKHQREITCATLDKHLASEWKSRAQHYGLNVQAWLPENWLLDALDTEFFPLQSPWAVWQKEDSALPTGLPLAWAPADPVQQPNHWIEFLAQTPRANQRGLWTASLGTHLKQQWARTQGLFSVRTKPLLPLGLALVLVLLGWMLSPTAENVEQRLAARFAQQMGESQPMHDPVAQVRARQAALAQHLAWQAEQLAQWQTVEQLMRRHPHWQLTRLVIDDSGVVVSLQGVTEAEQSRLAELSGQWRFEDNLAHGEMR